MQKRCFRLSSRLIYLLARRSRGFEHILSGVTKEHAALTIIFLELVAIISEMVYAMF